MTEPLNQEQKNTTPSPEAMRMPSLNQPIHHSHLGPILGVMIVVLVLILIGIYLWGSALSTKQTNTTEIPNNEPETPRAETDTQILNTLSPSDELDAIQADLDGTIVDSADSDMNTIDAELRTTLGE